MKLISISIVIIFIVFSAQASKVEKKYKECKPFQSNGYKVQGLNITNAQAAISCTSYFRALIDSGAKNCLFLNMIKQLQKDISPQSLSLLKVTSTNHNNPNLTAVVTSFINFAENNTDKWSENVVFFTEEFLNNKFPCKLK